MASPEIVRDEYGQTVPGARRPITYYRDKFRWMQKAEEAVKNKDPRGFKNARDMLISIETAYTDIPPPEPTPVERIGSGAASLAAGLNQMVPPELGGFTPEQEQDFARGRDLYRSALPPGEIDWWGLGGEAAVGAPFMLLPQFRAASAGLIPRTAAGMGSGGAAGGTLFAESPRERMQNVTAGAIGGGAGAAALPPIIGATVRGGQRAIPMRLSPEMQAKQAAAARFGYEGSAAPTRGRLTGDPTQIGDEANLSRLPGGESLQSRFAEQGLQDVANVEQLMARYGGPTEPGAAGDVLGGAVRGQSQALQRGVGEAYDVARAQRPDALIPGGRIAEVTQEVAEEFELPGAVRNRIGLLSETGASPQALEKFDKLLTANTGINKATDNAIRRLKRETRGLIDEAGDAYGGAYREAVSKARERFDAIGDMRTIVNKLDREALDPIKVVPTIKSGGIKELTALRDFVAESNPEAWQSIRAALATDIAEQAMPSGNFSQAAYNRAIKKLGPERLRVLFGDEGAAQIQEFGSVVRDLYGPVRGSTENTSRTAIAQSRLMDGMLNRILRMVPFAGEVVSDLAEQGARRANVKASQLALNPAMRPPMLTSGTLPSGAFGGLLGAQTIETQRR